MMGIIVILVIIIAIMGFSMLTSSGNQVNIENTIFDIPSGFHQGEMSKLNHVNLTNGKESIFIYKCSGNDIEQIIEEYEDYKKSENDSVSTSNFTVNNTIVYKSTINNTKTVHYWFEYGDKVYSIYTWGVQGDIDEIVSNIIKSAH